MKDFGILVFGHTRASILGDLLESLDRQGATEYVDAWVDGYQGKSDLKNRVQITHKVVDNYNVGVRRYHHGQLGFRKMMLQAMQSAVNNYKHIVFLEDDCFPSRNAISVFRQELEKYENDPSVFSIYGHHFGMAEEDGVCSRFQGWGWATTSDKLAPFITRLIECYSMSESDFRKFTRQAMTNDVVNRLDVTPPRLPTDTLRKFFAWDETLALLTAMEGLNHRPTPERVIYNCGLGEGSAHFAEHDIFKNPPFNMVSPSTVWDVY